MESYTASDAVEVSTATQLLEESVARQDTHGKERLAALLKRHTDWSYLGGNNPNADGYYDF